MGRRTIRRRELLSATALGVAGLAGCTGDNETGSTENQSDATTSGPSPGDDSTPASSSSVQTPVAGADGAATFQYDVTNTGYSSASGPTGPVEVAWEFQPADGAFRTPAVVDGVVYVGSGTKVYALNAADGTTLWETETGNHVGTPATVVDGTVYIGGSYEDTRMYALNANDGSIEWTNDLGAGTGAPTVIDGTVYVGRRYTLYALSAADGTEQWRFEMGGRVDGAPAVADGTVFSGSYDQNVYAIDAEDGSESWRAREAEPGASSPTVADETLYVGGNFALKAFSTADGELQWQVGFDGIVYGSPAVSDGTVYASGLKTRALNATDGTERWQTNPGDAGTAGLSPVVDDGMVYVSDKDGHLHALDRDSGDQRWAFDVGGSVQTTPVVVDDAVIIAGNEGMYALVRS